MEILVWIVVAIVVVGVIAALVLATRRKRRSDELRERFGPEYDRTMTDADDRRAAESELAARRERVGRLDVRPLPAASRERYASEWKDVQARFVDDPRIALVQADQLVELVMRERGYPLEDFEQRASDISVDHPRVVEHYRAAHGISQRMEGNGADTEELREGFIHYRELFSELVDDRPSDAART